MLPLGEPVPPTPAGAQQSAFAAPSAALPATAARLTAAHVGATHLSPAAPVTPRTSAARGTAPHVGAAHPDAQRPAVRPSSPPARRPLEGPLDPGELLNRWLEATADGEDLRPRLLRCADGHLLSLPVARWAGPVDAADETLLARARGPVLDVGCGPGRLTAALHERGVEVLGLELVEALPVLAHRAGAPVLLQDVYGVLPRAGEWGSVLLADGNVGIGGDPVRLLRHLEPLLSVDGVVLLEVQPGVVPPPGRVRLEGLGVTSAWFDWTVVGIADVAGLARAAGLALAQTWECQDRAFAALRRG